MTIIISKIISYHMFFYVTKSNNKSIAVSYNKTNEFKTVCSLYCIFIYNTWKRQKTLRFFLTELPFLQLKFQDWN